MRLVRSLYTLSAPWRRDRGLLLNLLSGAVDIVPRDVVDFVRRRDSLEARPRPPGPLRRMLSDRGYYVESRELEDRVARWLAGKAKVRVAEREASKYVIATTLGCNLACRYCWQVIDGPTYRRVTRFMTPRMAGAALDYVDRDLKRRGGRGRPVFISVFGGEPLSDRPAARRLVRTIGDRCKDRNWRLHLTTNGKDLASWRRELRAYRPSIQVTVDGARYAPGRLCLMRAGHPLHGLYETIAALASEGCATIGLRFLASTDSVGQFVALADTCFRDPRLAANFTLAVAPLQNKSSRRMPGVHSKLAVLKALMHRLDGRDYSHRIAFQDWRFLAFIQDLRGRGALAPFPAFHYCEANVRLTCFDPQGRLYACYEVVGDPAMAVGTYWPAVRLDPARLEEFRQRSAFSIPACAACPLAPICGGGCQVRARKRQGDSLRPFCDGLRAEAAYLMAHWPKAFRIVTGKAAEEP